MLEALLKKTARAGARRSDVWLRIKKVEWLDGASAADVLLEMHGSRRTEAWELRAEGVLDALIGPSPARRVLVTRRHVMIDLQIGPFADLRFKGTARSEVALLADLWKAHRSIADDWLTVEDCFAGHDSLPQLLRAGKGFATGPSRLIVSYGSVLRDHGLSVTVSNLHPSRPYRLNGKWHAQRPRVSFCSIGRSYFVAARFRADPVG